MITSLEDLAKEVSCILLENYDQCKYDPRFTFWGVGQFWDKESHAFSDHEGEYFRPLLENILDHVGTRRKTDPSLHFSFLTSIAACSSYFLDLAKLEDVGPIVTDHRLLSEAALLYAQSSFQGIHFFEFLLKSVQGETDLGDAPAYRSLFERLYYRFGEERLEDEIYNSLELQLSAKVRGLSLQSLKRSLKPELQELCHAEIDLSSVAKNMKKARSKISTALGKIRIPKGYDGEVDWETFLSDRRKAHQAVFSVDLDCWARELLYHKEAKIFWGLVKDKGIFYAQEHYQRASAETVNTEQRGIYERLLEELASYELFDDTLYFHKTMKVQITRRE